MEAQHSSNGDSRTVPSVRTTGVAATLLAATLCGVAAGAPSAHAPIRVLTIRYRAWDGRQRHAYVALPAWYGPRDNNPEG